MRSANQEWDYPPGRLRYPPRRPRHYRVLDAEPSGTGWASPTTTRIVDIYFTIILTIVKMIFGAILGLMVFGCVWMIVQIVRIMVE